MSGGYTRTFTHLFAQIETHPTNLDGLVKPFEMKDIMTGMLQEHQKIPMMFNTKAGGMRLMDYRLFSDSVALLIACTDRNIPDPTMLNLETADARSMAADDGYLWAYSAHLFIGFKPMKVRGDYPAVLETMPKLARTAVTEFLNKSLRRDKYQAQIEEGVVKDVWPGLKITGDISSKLKEALEKGELTGIDLLNVNPSQTRGPGETGMSVTREALSFRRPRDKEMRRAFESHDKPSVLRRFMKWGHENDYQMIRVHLDRNADAPSHMDFRTDDPEADAEEMFFIRRSSRSFSVKLDSAHRECVDQVLSAGHQLLADQYSHKRRKDK